MVEITNANDVVLTVAALGVDGTIDAREMARAVVQDYNFTTSEDNTLISGAGLYQAKGVTRGNVTHEFSFTITGEDANLLETVATENGRSREIEFTAIGNTFTSKASSAYLTELARDGTDGEAEEWSVSGVVVVMDYHRNAE